MRVCLGIVAAVGGLATLPSTVRAEPEYDVSDRNHWSFLPRGNPRPPAFDAPADRAWVTTPVDAFILSRLREAGLRPAPEADRRALIRRVYFDLIGLPPSPDDVEQFVADPSPDAYEGLVDRLLASPRYGERWGRHWLDVVRFAETEGFEYDNLVAGAWRYRDYVIEALNADKPYDQFVREQVAGDETPVSNVSGTDHTLLVAASFNRLGPVRRNAGNADVAHSRNEVLTEMTNSLGSVFLGLTVGCARCHDHKFDPIRQRDYYQLQAFLAATQERNLTLVSKEEEAAWHALADKTKAEIKKLETELDDATTAEAHKALEERLHAALARLPPSLPVISTVEDAAERRTIIHVLARGNADQPGEAVAARPLGVLLPEGTGALPADSSRPRSRLAEWLTQPDHPLTARVLVNRLWRGHIGRGIVDTPNDFGLNGEQPSHPELLDYLANELVAGGWRTKPIHRLIVLSSAYRQSASSHDEAAGRAKDPENRLLWRANRRRLEAEEIRDAMLAVSGRLNLNAGGPSVILPVERDLVKLLYKPSQWEVTADRTEHDRRSVYLLAKRNLHLPFMEVFDQPDAQTSCARRESSTHAPQALEMLNGQLANEMAAALAERLALEAGWSPERQADLAFHLVAGRPPTTEEQRLALAFLRDQSLREFALAMLNLNAFLYVD